MAWINRGRLDMMQGLVGGGGRICQKMIFITWGRRRPKDDGLRDGIMTDDGDGIKEKIKD